MTKIDDDKITELTDRFNDLTKVNNADTFVKEAYSFIDDYCDTIIKPQSTCLGTGCSHCCTNSIIAVSKLEYVFMLEYSDLARKQAKRHVPTMEMSMLAPLMAGSMKTKKLGDCPFLCDGKCTIYAYRPIACRTFFSIDSPSLCAKGKKHHLFNSHSNEAIKTLNDFFQQISIENDPLRGVLEIRDVFKR